MTRVFYEPEDFHVRVEGHAGSAPKGEDLVCAAVSALAWTLADAAQDYQAGVLINETAAIIDVRCWPNARDEEKCEQMFGVIMGGFRLLADKYPEFIKIGGADNGR